MKDRIRTDLEASYLKAKWENTLKYFVKGCSLRPKYSAGKPPPILKKSTSKLDALINEDVGDAAMFFLPGELSLTANATYHDFSLPNPTEEVEITITAILIDFYGNPVVDAPISFVGTGVEAWREVGYEQYEDFGVDGVDGTEDFGEDNECFSWRDYGADDDPQTADMGTFNETHDAFDTDGDGASDIAEVSEAFEDFGVIKLRALMISVKKMGNGMGTA